MPRHENLQKEPVEIARTPANQPKRVLAQFLALPPIIRLLLITQLAFNVGFYLVVPFLATYLTESLAASGAIVGLVLGLRTFSQQGLFFLGGGLSDRWGVRPVLLTGILIRVVGFLVAGFSDNIPQLIVGVILIGFAGALFSPAAESALAIAGGQVQAEGGATRTEIFALDTLFSRTGALAGPIIGALLIEAGFLVTCVVAAALFALLFLAHFFILPDLRPENPTPVLSGWSTVLRNRTFMLFALAYSTYLVTYNQQYLSLPVELTRARGNQNDLGAMFIYSGILILLLQLPLTRLSQRLGRRTSLGLGFGLMALAFLIPAACAPVTPPAGIAALLPAVLMLALLHTGHMIAVPVARDLVGVLAGERNLGAYFGFLNTFGGIAVLLTSLLLGPLLDDAAHAQPSAALPWLLLTGMCVASTWLLLRLGRRFPEA
ncbi:MFS transporter [Corynebacterium sp. S7]